MKIGKTLASDLGFDNYVTQYMGWQDVQEVIPYNKESNERGPFGVLFCDLGDQLVEDIYFKIMRDIIFYENR